MKPIQPDESLRSGTFHFTVSDPFYILDLINEARAEKGEPPLDITDIADPIQDGPMTIKDFR